MDVNTLIAPGKPIVFFDVETNGLSGSSSVLSIAAVKALFDGKDIDIAEEFSRFYYRKPGEPENREALAVNGLTDAAIRKKRGQDRYAEHFHHDPDFAIFCAGVHHYVGHNIAFDRKFIPFPLKYCFCTMKENTTVIKIKRPYGGFKYPRLSEAAEFYGLAPESDRLHGSDYDTRLTYEIFKIMLREPRTRQKVREFLKRQ
jgi:DNA polymerase-3 subunit epsilon